MRKKCETCLFEEEDCSICAGDVMCLGCSTSECKKYTPKQYMLQDHKLHEPRSKAAQEQMIWDEYFLGIAEAVALKSKDESSKIGAVIVGPDHEIRSTGYNGFPRGFNDNDPEKQIRPGKYKYFEHAERNAIYNAARFGAKVKNCTMYCQWPPCSDCARAIIQAGIKKLVIKHGILTCPKRWHEDMGIAAGMLRECGVKFEVINNE